MPGRRRYDTDFGWVGSLARALSVYCISVSSAWPANEPILTIEICFQSFLISLASGLQSDDRKAKTCSTDQPAKWCDSHPQMAPCSSGSRLQVHNGHCTGAHSKGYGVRCIIFRLGRGRSGCQVHVPAVREMLQPMGVAASEPSSPQPSPLPSRRTMIRSRMQTHTACFNHRLASSERPQAANPVSISLRFLLYNRLQRHHLPSTLLPRSCRIRMQVWHSP